MTLIEASQAEVIEVAREWKRETCDRQNMSPSWPLSQHESDLLAAIVLLEAREAESY